MMTDEQREARIDEALEESFPASDPPSFIGAGAPLPFKKGGVCRIDVAAASWRGAGHLQWFATPRMLRGVK